MVDARRSPVEEDVSAAGVAISGSSMQNSSALEMHTIDSGEVQAARTKIEDPEALYSSFVRALRRRSRFGILFLECTPAKGQEIFSRAKRDLPKKTIARLTLTEPIDNLLTLVKEQENVDSLNVLFIEGIEKSLAPYITSEEGRDDYYKLEVLPPILNHINRKRENFREWFPNLCFVFVVPPFALKYFMSRAVDFFDWRSGVWTFSPPNDELARETARALDGRYDEYLLFLDEERKDKIIKLRNLIDVKNQSEERKVSLLQEQGAVLIAARNWTSALRCFDEVASMRETDETAQLVRGLLLEVLKHLEEAIAAYDAALAINPDKYEALNGKGTALAALNRNEEAIAAYDAALAINPDDPEAFNSKGIALYALGRNEEAIAAYNAALAIEPDEPKSLYNKGAVLRALGQLEEAIAVYDAVLSINSDDPEALYNKGFILAELGQTEEAIAAFDAVLAIKPNHPNAHYSKACSYALSDQLENAIASLKKAIELDGTDKYIELAKTDADFDGIRDRPQFQALIAQYEQKQHSEEQML